MKATPTSQHIDMGKFTSYELSLICVALDKMAETIDGSGIHPVVKAQLQFLRSGIWEKTHSEAPDEFARKMIPHLGSDSLK